MINVSDMTILCIREHQELIEQAAQWFHEKWHVPKEAYLESMKDSCNEQVPVPEWYVIMEGQKIIAGLGVIENDFHKRRDLTPNVCAVFVEREYRKQGIAGKMLDFVCEEFKKQGIQTLYLITDHTSFYERYGWEFLCMVEEDSSSMTRMYIHKA